MSTPGPPPKKVTGYLNELREPPGRELVSRRTWAYLQLMRSLASLFNLFTQPNTCEVSSTIGLYGDPTEPGPSEPRPSVITVLFLWMLIINLNNGPKGQNITED